MCPACPLYKAQEFDLRLEERVFFKVGVCVYNCLITYTPFPYPKLCPYPKPP